MPVHLEVADHVAVLTFDEPGRKNAMTPQLGDALAARVEELRRRSEVRAVILAGAGGTFSAGGDLTMLAALRQLSTDDARLHMLAFYARYLSVTQLEVPVIAAVEGAAMGAGLCVALACDLCVVDRDAKLGFNFTQLGLHPGMGATYLVPRRVGAQRAAELLFSGRRFDGRHALELGLALEACAAGEVLPRARELARQVASSAPLAVRGLKRALGVDQAGLARALEHEAGEQALGYATADLAEGLRAAAERRPPVFSGR